MPLLVECKCSQHNLQRRITMDQVHSTTELRMKFSKQSLTGFIERRIGLTDTVANEPCINNKLQRRGGAYEP